MLVWCWGWLAIRLDNGRDVVWGVWGWVWGWVAVMFGVVVGLVTSAAATNMDIDMGSAGWRTIVVATTATRATAQDTTNE